MYKDYDDPLMNGDDLPGIPLDIPDPPLKPPPLSFTPLVPASQEATYPLDFTQQQEDGLIGAWPTGIKPRRKIALILGPAITPGHLRVMVDGQESTIQSKVHIQIVSSETLERQRAIRRYKRKRELRGKSKPHTYQCRSNFARVRPRRNGRFIPLQGQNVQTP